MRFLGLIRLALAIILAACSGGSEHGTPPPAPAFAANIMRTSHGVVHVRAEDFRGIGYGLAYAYAQDNVCMFADTLLTVRGERSRYFGADAHATRSVNGEYGAASDFVDMRNDESDFFFRGYLDLDELRAGYAVASQETRDLLAGYVAGYNRYLRERAAQLPAACANAAWVKPITVDDMYLVLAEKALHASGEVFAREFVAAGRGATPVSISARRVPERLAALQARLGSNALALGRALTADGRGLLLGNPHYPWTSTDRFYQAHLTVPGKYDAMGVILGGIPIVVIGFNQDLAWTHTVTTALHFTTFKLQLDQADPSGTSYLVDGVVYKMRPRTVSIEVRQPDGSLAARSRTFYFSKFGPVLLNPAAGMEWTTTSAFVLADPNRANTRMLDQWLAIGRSHSVDELKGALDSVVGLPWINTVAADRHGQTLFADASVVPHVTAAQFGGPCLAVPDLLALDGARSSCAWGADPDAPAGIFSPKNAPFLQRSDYVANSNDSYWLTNANQLLTGYSPMYGRTQVEQKLRTRIGFKLLQQRVAQGRPLTAGDVEQLAFANRIYAAELVLPQVLAACGGAAEPLLADACDALARWDRHADLDSKGALLFREFWNAAAQLPDKWTVALDPADPVNTPHTLRAAALPAVLDALRLAAARLRALKLPLDARLGQYQTDVRNGVAVPIHGAIGDIDGSYNSVHMGSGPDASGYHQVIWGTSYVQVVGFDAQGPVARGLLVYGQSVDPSSPWYCDQLPLYSRKEWSALPFHERDVRADPGYVAQKISE